MDVPGEQSVAGTASPGWRTTTFNPFGLRSEGKPKGPGSCPGELYKCQLPGFPTVPRTLVFLSCVPMQSRFPLQELIRKAHCAPCAYPGPGPGSPWQSHRKRTVTLSMAGNLGVGAEQTLGCSRLEVHFCHQICWVTSEKLLDPSGPPRPDRLPARTAGAE